MQVKIKPGYWPDLPKMVQTIHDAGYKPIEGGIELRVSGKVVKTADGLALVVDGLKTPRTLALTPAKDDTDTFTHLERHLGQTVELDATWKPAPKGKAGAGSLSVTAIHQAGEKKAK